VLARLATDPVFRSQLDRDPRGALAEYDLDTDDLRRVADALGDGKGRTRGGGSALRALLTRRGDDEAVS